MRTPFLLILAAAGCGSVNMSHGPKEVVSEAATQNVRRSEHRERATATQAVPSSELSSVRLGLRQVPSVKEVTIQLELRNTGQAPVNITSNPRFDHRSFGREPRETEVEIQIVDARGRGVPYRCTRCLLDGTYRPQRMTLAPGSTHTFEFTLDSSCYDLEPGERLSFIASYANLFDTPQVGQLLEDVQPNDWIDLSVPINWSRK